MISFGLLLLLAGAPEDPPVTFRKVVLTDKYYCDGITAGDINGDGAPDIVAGPFWYEGPSFRTAHSYYVPVVFPKPPSPTNCMFVFVHDFNGDGRNDILRLGRVHKHEARWFENPGKADGPWKSHFVFERIRGESPWFGDLNGDGRPDLVCHWENRWGYVSPDPSDATKPWVFHAVSEPWKEINQFYHGTGVGDVNGDGRPDLLLNHGWYLQPKAGASAWTRGREEPFGERGGAQILLVDVRKPGSLDIVTSLDGHGWGLAWFEQSGRRHMMMGDRSEERKYSIAFSQPHALAAGDINGDGLTDIVTGKRVWAHGPKGDVEPDGTPIVAWFRLVRGPDGPRFVPHVVDSASGVGVQVTVSDVTGDGAPDILTASKLGSFLFISERKEGSK